MMVGGCLKNKIMHNANYNLAVWTWRPLPDSKVAMNMEKKKTRNQLFKKGYIDIFHTCIYI